MILIIFIVGLAFADKLDRTYLPPPGSKFSGGSPGAIDVPFEHPKLHSSANNGYYNPSEIAIGIDRVAPKKPIVQDMYSSRNTPSTYTDNTFTVSTTMNPHTKNTVFSSKNGYSTAKPFQNLNNFQDIFNDSQQLQYTSNENEVQITENYPNIYQGNIPIAVINPKDFSNDLLSNKTKFYGNKNINVNNIPQSSPSPQLATNFINNQYGPDQYFSSPIPTINTNSISLLLPSTAKYEYSSTLGPKQFLSSTSKPLQFPTSTPIGSKISPVFNYADIKNRPERIQAQADREASILNYESSISPDGYAYSFDTSNGIHADESGVTVNGVKAKGSYSYIGDDGKLYSVVYTADEYGFQPQGDHLPTSPPIPDAILKVIEQVSKEKEAGIVDDGSYDENKYGYKKYHNGFYSPKSGITKVHSTVEGKDKLIKNINKVSPNYSGGIRNQVVNKNDKVLTTNKDFVKNANTIPVINSYANTVNNLENLGSQFPQQEYKFHNKTEIQHIGSNDVPNIATGDDATRSPNNSLKQEYINPITDDEIIQLVDTQIVVDNEGKHDDIGIGHNKKYNPNEYYNEDSNKGTGYHYNPPKYAGKKEFPPRFSDIYNSQKEAFKQETSNKITPKPFLTPYVFETNEDKPKYDENGRPILNLESDYYDEELAQNNKKYPSYFDSDLNLSDGYNRTDSLDIKLDNDPIRKLYLSEGTNAGVRDPQIVNEGYSYQQGTLDSVKTSYDPYLADRQSYSSTISTSTVAPTAFTSRINTSQPKDPNYNVGTPETSIGSNTVIHSTTYIPNVYQTNIQLNKTVNLPHYSTIRPGFIKKGTIPSDTKFNYSTDLKNTSPRTEFSTNIPILGNSYAPSLDITHSDEYDVHPTKEIINGEDFSGPKQSQRFDPVTGYYY